MSSLAYVSNYSEGDNIRRDSVGTDFIQFYNVDANGNVPNQMDMLRDLESRSYPGQTNDQLAKMEKLMKFAKNMYMNDTEQYKVVNNLANVTNYVAESVDKEFGRLSTLRDKTFSNVHKMRQHYMLKKYDISYNQFVSGIVQFTLFTIVLCGLIYAYAIKPEPPITTTVAWGVIAGILTIYLFIVILFVKQSMMRRKDDWNKYYFGTMDQNKKACMG